MPIVEMLMPKMGESVMEATVLSWLKQEGDVIESDESVLEVATDKVDTEVPSTFGGTITKVLVKEGEVVQVGAPLCLIESDDDMDGPAKTSVKSPAAEAPKATPAAPAAAAPQAAAVPAALEAELTAAIDAREPISLDKNGASRFYSPLVLNIARTEAIPMPELEGLTGTGLEGRVTKRDILSYLEQRKGKGAGFIAAPSSNGKSAHAGLSMAARSEQALPMVSGEDEIIQMDRMRLMIADRMVASKQTSPHVTSFVEADMTKIVNWRKANKAEFERTYGEKLTFTPFFIWAIVRAIRELPMINAQVDGKTIIRKGKVNVGMAVALPSGNLIVPVIHNADQMNLAQLTAAVNDLSKRARENKLKPDDVQGATYTMSNVGGFGNVMGTPIIMQPQVAIMAVGAIQKKAAVLETPDGDVIAVRHKMFLSHSYDHRVVDGALGGMFVKKVATFLEDFAS